MDSNYGDIVKVYMMTPHGWKPMAQLPRNHAFDYVESLGTEAFHQRLIQQFEHLLAWVQKVSVNATPSQELAIEAAKKRLNKMGNFASWVNEAVFTSGFMLLQYDLDLEVEV